MRVVYAGQELAAARDLSLTLERQLSGRDSRTPADQNHYGRDSGVVEGG